MRATKLQFNMIIALINDKKSYVPELINDTKVFSKKLLKLKSAGAIIGKLKYK